MACYGPHKFTVYGRVGLRAPVCQRYQCQAPNPRPLTEGEQEAYSYYLVSIGKPPITGLTDTPRGVQNHIVQTHYGA